MKHGWISVVWAVALMGLTLIASPVSRTSAQEPITSGWSYSQAFDGIGTTQTATLPTNWKVDKNPMVRAVGTWAAAGTATEQYAGDNMSSSAANGIYNYGAGVYNTAADRAVGWISSGSATKSGNLHLWLRNDSPTDDLGSINVSYDVERYRNGSNTAGFTIQLYFSTDGSAWTPAGASFLTTFAANADNAGFASAPGETTSVTDQVLALPTAIPPGGSLYLAWNYSVTSGTTTSNAQGLGIDNVTLDDPMPPTAITLRTLTARVPVTPLAAAPVAGLVLAGGLAAFMRRRKA